MGVLWLYQSVRIVFCFLTSVSCQYFDIPVSCDIVGPIVSENCCNVSRVPINSVGIEYFVTQTGNSEERWRLDATVKWNAPTEDATDAYMYSVDLLPTVTLEDLDFYRLQPIETPNLCNGRSFESFQCPTTPYFSTVTEEETATFSSILFGFSFTFQLQVIHSGVISREYTCFYACDVVLDPSLDLQAPDCLNATGDVEFCRNQPIPVSTEPRDVEVDWTMDSLMSVIVHIRWSMPLVVNGKVQEYTIKAYRLTTDLTFDESVLETSQNRTEIQITSESLNIRNGGFLAGYSYHILVTPFVSLPARYRSQGKTFEGNSANKRISISTAIDVTTSKMMHTVTEGANPTTKSRTDSSEILPIVLLVSSVWAVILAIVIVAIMLLYRRKREVIARDNVAINLSATT